MRRRKLSLTLDLRSSLTRDISSKTSIGDDFMIVPRPGDRAFFFDWH